MTVRGSVRFTCDDFPIQFPTGGVEVAIGEVLFVAVGGRGATHTWLRQRQAVAVVDAVTELATPGEVLSARLAFDEAITGMYASDHFGLVVDVRWPTR